MIFFNVFGLCFSGAKQSSGLVESRNRVEMENVLWVVFQHGRRLHHILLMNWTNINTCILQTHTDKGQRSVLSFLLPVFFRVKTVQLESNIQQL